MPIRFRKSLWVTGPNIKSLSSTHARKYEKSTSAVRSADPGSTRGSWSWWLRNPWQKTVREVSSHKHSTENAKYHKSCRLDSSQKYLDSESVYNLPEFGKSYLRALRLFLRALNKLTT